MNTVAFNGFDVTFLHALGSTSHPWDMRTSTADSKKYNLSPVWRM